NGRWRHQRVRHHLRPDSPDSGLATDVEVIVLDPLAKVRLLSLVRRLRLDPAAGWGRGRSLIGHCACGEPKVLFCTPWPRFACCACPEAWALTCPTPAAAAGAACLAKNATSSRT